MTIALSHSAISRCKVSYSFPGFNPYLELPAYWPDFHSTFINYWREAIADSLPHEYEASIGEHVYLVEIDPDSRKRIAPDVAIADRGSDAHYPTAGTAVATLEPVTIPVTILDGPRETHIEILHRPDRSLVTTIGLLSPTNKQNHGRADYLMKRNALMKQSVHLVELDLLRGGERLPFAGPLPPADYYYVVSDYNRRPDCDVYCWNLKQPLPTLPIPLRTPDADILVSLAEVFQTAFARGRFERRIDYTKRLLGN